MAPKAFQNSHQVHSSFDLEVLIGEQGVYAEVARAEQRLAWFGGTGSDVQAGHLDELVEKVIGATGTANAVDVGGIGREGT